MTIDLPLYRIMRHRWYDVGMTNDEYRHVNRHVHVDDIRMIVQALYVLADVNTKEARSHKWRGVHNKSIRVMFRKEAAIACDIAKRWQSLI